jgi:hypothetical protein
MYGWIWRNLPGPIALRLFETLVLMLAVIALLLFVVFPIVEPHLPLNQVTVPKSK